MTNRKQYEELAHAKLKELEKQVTDIQQQIQILDAQLSEEHRSTLLRLQELRHGIKQKLSDLSAAGDDAWHEIRDGLEHYWTAVGNEMKSYEGFSRKKS